MDSSNGKYAVPDKYSYAKTIILEQLNILDNLFPCRRQPAAVAIQESSTESVAKKKKLNYGSASSSTAVQPSPSTSHSSHTHPRGIGLNKEKITSAQLNESLNGILHTVNTSQSSPFLFFFKKYFI